MNVPVAESYHQFTRDAVQRGRFASGSAMVEQALALLLRRQRTEGPRQPVNGEKSLDAILFESKHGVTRELPIDEIMADLPDEVLDQLPVDGSVQHDR